MPTSALVMLLPIYIVLSSVGAAHSNCYYNDPGGYSLRWLVLGDKLVFRLDYSNFASNAVTGIGFGNTSNANASQIIVQTNNGNVGVFITPLLRTVPTFNTSGNALATYSSSYRNRNLQAEFSRPIAVNSSNLSSCQTWNFITTPARSVNGKYNITSANTKSQQICNVKEECDALKMLRTMSANRFDFNAGHSPYFGSSIVEMSAAPWIPSNKRKRQAGYQPTNNIYGYNYDSSASPSDAAKLVVNPNYAYLNDALSEGYARNYVQAETQYAQSNQNNGFQVYDAVPIQSAILSNDQQNSLNYQQIMQSNPSWNTVTPNYSNNNYNNYGYVQRDQQVTSAPQYYGRQQATGNYANQGYTPLSSGGSSTQGTYQSVVDLKTTRLRDPTYTTYNSDVSSQNSPLYRSDVPSQNSAMYYPYRTSTGQSYGGNSASGSNVYTNTPFQDVTVNSCSLPDPYWCSDYVNVYMNSGITLSGLDKNTVCQSMARALQDSYNGCCQTLRAAGCN